MIMFVYRVNQSALHRVAYCSQYLSQIKLFFFDSSNLFCLTCKMTAKKNLVFFDVDYTLIDGNSGLYATKRLIQHGLFKKRRLLQALYYTTAALIKDQNVTKIYQIALKDMIGMHIEEVLKIGQECLQKDLLKRLKNKAITLLKNHQKKGDHIVLLTSGSQMIMQNLAQHLGVDEFYCITPQTRNNIITAELSMPLCYAEGKIHYAKIAAQKNNLDLSEAYFYTDHHTDIPLLELVGHPHCVDPNGKLKRYALNKGWPVHYFK